MSDYISRQAAISAICNACGKIDCDKMDKCEKLQLPPANCSEFPNSSDTISRQQAIEALDKRFDSIPMEQTSEILMLRKDLRNLPPAQPEQLGTNLAEVGTEAISRQSVIEMLDETKRIARQNIDGVVLMTFERVLDSLVNITNALPTIQPDNNLQKLADEIASFKRCVKSDNSDYLTGYLCALSVVEGMIAEKMEATT